MYTYIYIYTLWLLKWNFVALVNDVKSVTIATDRPLLGALVPPLIIIVICYYHYFQW